MPNNETMNKFAKILGKLSPENLYCDGECSYMEAQQKKDKLKSEWKRLETELGRKVSEDQVLNWVMNNN
jgi:hypothetical protein